MYGLHYRCKFDPINSLDSTPVYMVEILEKGYSGQIIDCKGATVPVLHQWETDDPKAAIKGSSLTINLINEGSLPLSSFFSTEDDGFLVKFWYKTNLLFTGFLVQDDCSEILVDFTHEINLSANDNLGLLKDASLDQAGYYRLYYTALLAFPVTATVANNSFLFTTDTPYYYIGGKTRIKITSGPDAGTYMVDSYSYNPISNSLLVYVSEPIPTDWSGTDQWMVLREAQIVDKIDLGTIISMCLSVTKLNLSVNIYTQIIEESQDNSRSFFEQTLIDPQTFLKSDTEYTDCYDVLTKILERFNMTLFQANGVWNIVRWDELRYNNNLIPGFTYSSVFDYVSTITKDAPFPAGINEITKPETGLIHKVCRPYQYDKETFNYQQPKNLLRNYNLQKLGDQIRTYTTGTGINLKTISEYSLPDWDASARLDSGSGTYFIRVTSDDLGNEIERVLVVTKDVKSHYIEANAGDTFIFSFSFRTEDSQAGNVVIQVFVELNDGTTVRFFHNPATTTGANMWQIGAGYSYNVQSGDNTNQWHQVEVDASRFPIPYDGFLYVYLRVADLSAPIHETYYKDIRFEYTPRINQSTKIIGHTHQSTQTGNIKQNEDVEIFVDSSPRNSIAGTLFLNEKVGVLQKRTLLWKLPAMPDAEKLGQVMTFEQLFWRRIPRSILEGSLYGLTNTGRHISLLSVFNYTYFDGVSFVFGRLEIDYKNNKLDGTLWEIWDEGETDENLESIYDFKYLYSTK